MILETSLRQSLPKATGPFSYFTIILLAIIVTWSTEIRGLTMPFTLAFISSNALSLLNAITRFIKTTVNGIAASYQKSNWPGGLAPATKDLFEHPASLTKPSSNSVKIVSAAVSGRNNQRLNLLDNLKRVVYPSFCLNPPSQACRINKVALIIRNDWGRLSRKKLPRSSRQPLYSMLYHFILVPHQEEDKGGCARF